MKYLILSCLASIGLISIAACSDDSTNQTTTASTSQSASMQTDTKAIKPAQQ